MASKAMRKGKSRSKAEIELFKLLSLVFKCQRNKKLFDGWDADIIIPKYKLAILWNGGWHYKQISPVTPLAKIQARDRIKITKIEKAGWRWILVKDYSNNMTPKKAFKIIINKLIEGTLKSELIE